MYSGQAVFPASGTSGSFTISAGSGGITIDQLIAVVAMHALMSNPNYTPHTYQEMAQKAKEIAQTMIGVL